MKRIIVLILLSGVITLSGSAQRVYKDGDRAILDCTASTGMPAGAVTNVKKCVDGTADNYEYRDGSNGKINPYAWENDRVYEKLEVAPMNVNTSGVLSSSTDTDGMYWTDAYNKCKNLKYNGTGWRLPVQRELQLISIFYEPFNTIFKSLGIPDGQFSYPFWSSEINNMYSWTTNPGSAHTPYNLADGGNSKKFEYGRWVRCVREL